MLPILQNAQGLLRVAIESVKQKEQRLQAENGELHCNIKTRQDPVPVCPTTNNCETRRARAERVWRAIKSQDSEPLVPLESVKVKSFDFLGRFKDSLLRSRRRLAVTC